jgi:hypothetical protein
MKLRVNVMSLAAAFETFNFLAMNGSDVVKTKTYEVKPILTAFNLLMQYYTSA